MTGPIPLVVVELLIGTVIAQAQPKPATRLQSPAIVRGYIGGESHDHYVVRVRKGQTLTLSLSWCLEANNKAYFSLSESPNYYTAQPLKFGTEFEGGKRWAGKIPRSGDYYIDVVAHPVAQYTLKVSVK